MLTKPTWMKSADYNELMLRYNMVPACKHCGDMDRLTVDHIVPRADEGTDEPSNLQVLCQSCNSRKGARSDRYWAQSFYWDNALNPGALRASQRIGVYETLLGYADWFARPWSQINRKLYTLGWIVGAGKTLAVPTAAFTLNHLIRSRNGIAAPRVDRVLVLCKEQAIRDGIAGAFEDDIVRYGLCPTPPRVGVIDVSTKLSNWIITDQKDIWVSCIQMFFEENGTPRKDLASILARFPLIVIDEPHFAMEQVLKIVEAAATSLCVGTTGTPITANLDVLKRFVLLSKYDYQDAVRNDQSLKFISEKPEFQPYIIEEVGITEADVMQQGNISQVLDTNGVAYAKQAEPAKTVASRVLQYVSWCDQKDKESEVLALHRGTLNVPADHWYPVHAMIRVEGINIGTTIRDMLNDQFERNRKEFPAELGYRANVVHSDPEGAGRKGEYRLDPESHPWFAVKRNHGTLTEDSARFLIVVGMGREGIDNPWCGVVGLACQTDSAIEIIQRVIGRQARSVDVRADGRILRVPPRRLDSIRIVTHVGFNNRPVIAAGLRFVMNMGDWLDQLISMDELIAGKHAPSVASVDDRGFLTTAEKIAIAARIGEALRDGRPLPRGELIEEMGQGIERRETAIDEWISRIVDDPIGAESVLHHRNQLDAIPAVIREDPTNIPSDDDITKYVRIHHPQLVPILQRINDPDIRGLATALFVQHTIQFALPSLASWTNLHELRRDLAKDVVDSLGNAYRWRDETGKKDVQPIHRAAAIAVKEVLGVPPGESAAMGGRFDIPAYHHLIERPAQWKELVGFVRDHLIAAGACPELAWAFNRPERDEVLYADA